MFFPYGDTPNPPNYKPWMTRLLILANFAVYFLVSSPLAGDTNVAGDPSIQDFLAYLAQRFNGMIPQEILDGITRYDVFTFVHGYKPGAPSVIDLLSSLFLHAGIWHLLGNMLFLWIYGDNVEHRLGRVGFLAAYLVSGVAATLAFGLFAGGSMAPLIGASGAISGILGIYFILFRQNRIKIFVFLFPFLVTRWYVPARIVLAIYLVVDNVLPFVIGSDSGVAYGAHLGGFGAGLLIGLAVAKINPKAIWQRIFPARRTVIREVPKADRPDPRSVVIDAEYVDDESDRRS